jgi:hypothetical protein
VSSGKQTPPKARNVLLQSSMRTTAFFFCALTASVQALLVPVVPSVRHNPTTMMASSRLLEDAIDDDFDGKAVSFVL